MEGFQKKIFVGFIIMQNETLRQKFHSKFEKIFHLKFDATE